MQYLKSQDFVPNKDAKRDIYIIIYTLKILEKLEPNPSEGNAVEPQLRGIDSKNRGGSPNAMQAPARIQTLVEELVTTVSSYLTVSHNILVILWSAR